MQTTGSFGIMRIEVLVRSFMSCTSLNTSDNCPPSGPPPPLEEMDPSTKQYWMRVHKLNIVAKQKKKKMNKLR